MSKAKPDAFAQLVKKHEDLACTQFYKTFVIPSQVVFALLSDEHARVVRLVKAKRENRARGRLGAMVFTDGYRQACDDLLVALEQWRRGGT